MEEIAMPQSVPTVRFSESRRRFYAEFFEFARQYPEMKICLYVRPEDLPLLAEKEWFPVVCRLLDLCNAGRLTLVGTLPGPHPLEHLRKVKSDRDLSRMSGVPARDERFPRTGPEVPA